MILQANALRLPLADASVHAVVTSAPYWGLRTYDGDHQQQRWPDGWVGQLGLESTPWLYLDHLRWIFAEVRRVLRPDGTLWLNLGDTYANDWSCQRRNVIGVASCDRSQRQNRLSGGIKNKNLLGLPWRAALALQDDGWILRSEIIWHKPAPVPESVRDRPTRCHEHVFLFAKSSRYYYDWYGVMEPTTGNAKHRGSGVTPKAVSAGSRVRTPLDPRSQTPGRIRHKANASFSAAVSGLVSRRRLRDVWSIPSESYKGSHFATFPRSLPSRCIQAATSERGVCPACGAPWVRIIERPKVGDWARDKAQKSAGIARCKHSAEYADPRHVGWRPSCRCAAGEPVPALVLDPFAGSGTVGVAAAALGRHAVLVDVAYQHLQRARLSEVPPLIKEMAAFA